MGSNMNLAWLSVAGFKILNISSINNRATTRRIGAKKQACNLVTSNNQFVKSIVKTAKLMTRHLGEKWLFMLADETSGDDSGIQIDQVIDADSCSIN